LLNKRCIYKSFWETTVGLVACSMNRVMVVFSTDLLRLLSSSKEMSNYRGHITEW